jgi:CheY-like chemotaxis protein
MKKNILLVDDEQIFHFINIKVIEQSGIDCDIRTASNGSEALQLINGYLTGTVAAPDIIFLDLNMPVMDGFEFIRVFQQMEIPNKDMVTIVVLTSSMNTEDMKKAMSLGIQRFITKPLTEEDVSKIVFAI